MKATPFDPSRHLAPIPFDEALRRKAQELKEAGLDWQPHVGCFLWDPERTIPAPSPFGGRIYFLLNLNRFLQFYSGVEELKSRLVWLPTWYQARLLLGKMGVRPGVADDQADRDAGTHLLNLYERILRALREDTARP